MMVSTFCGHLLFMVALKLLAFSPNVNHSLYMCMCITVHGHTHMCKHAHITLGLVCGKVYNLRISLCTMGNTRHSKVGYVVHLKVCHTFTGWAHSRRAN